jgi:hypothetical protein
MRKKIIMGIIGLLAIVLVSKIAIAKTLTYSNKSIVTTYLLYMSGDSKIQELVFSENELVNRYHLYNSQYPIFTKQLEIYALQNQIYETMLAEYTAQKVDYQVLLDSAIVANEVELITHYTKLIEQLALQEASTLYQKDLNAYYQTNHSILTQEKQLELKRQFLQQVNRCMEIDYQLNYLGKALVYQQLILDTNQKLLDNQKILASELDKSRADLNTTRGTYDSLVDEKTLIAKVIRLQTGLTDQQPFRVVIDVHAALTVPYDTLKVRIDNKNFYADQIRLKNHQINARTRYRQRLIGIKGEGYLQAQLLSLEIDQLNREIFHLAKDNEVYRLKQLTDMTNKRMMIDTALAQSNAYGKQAMEKDLLIQAGFSTQLEKLQLEVESEKYLYQAYVYVRELQELYLWH